MEKTLSVKLLEATPNPMELIYASFRQCYAPGGVGDKWEAIKDGTISKDEQIRLIEEVMESGHESPIEHVNFSFAIEGVSRVLTHQLVRHRIGSSFSHQSQRYCFAGGETMDFPYITPPRIKEDREIHSEYVELMMHIDEKYKKIEGMLREKYGNQAKEDARFTLPGGAETKIVVTMNCRALWNLFNLRTCERAQWEIRELSNQMLDICKSIIPVIFNMAGPKCEHLGYCPEHEKFSCGKYPIKSEFLDR